MTKGHGHASIWGLGVGGGRAGRAIGGKRDPQTNHAFEGVFRDILVRAKTVDRSPRSSWARAAGQKKWAQLQRLALLSGSASEQTLASCAWGRSKRVSAMTRKTITLKFVVLTVLAITLGIMVTVGAVHLKDNPIVRNDRAQANAELPNLQLSRVHL